jgi:hypothetical protein
MENRAKVRRDGPQAPENPSAIFSFLKRTEKRAEAA